ncbi:hypothetical protein [Arcticibacter sp.]|uniref:hypothetical protein n=1 Tax=Arcticibacter sp. TaxID=1872630 RepID=UPI00389062AA
MSKKWKLFGDECPICGSEAEVFTDSKDDGFAYDDDDDRCVECGLEGNVIIGDEDDNGGCPAYVSWSDFDDDEETVS